MRTLVVLAAGKSTRIGGVYKPDLLVAGRRMIDWQMAAAQCEETVIVAHSSQAFPEQKPHVKTVSTEERRGPASALRVGLALVQGGPVIVALADTWWSTTPSGSDWVGVCSAEGGRTWDYPKGETYSRSHVPNHKILDVCIGLYSFSDADALHDAVRTALVSDGMDREISMAEVLDAYRFPLTNVQIPEWLDVGSSETWRQADTILREAK